MTVAAVRQQTAVYFGGSTYDLTTRSYRNPTVTGLGAVRRGFPRESNEVDFFLSQAPGVMSGCTMVVECDEGHESREAMAGETDGLKYCRYRVILNVFFISMEAFTEDFQDYVDQIRDGIIAQIRLDRTLGSGGFEAGIGVGFMVGEGGEPWIRWKMSQPELAENRTKQYLMIEFDAHQYDHA